MVCQHDRYRHSQPTRDSKAICRKLQDEVQSHRPLKSDVKSRDLNMNSQISIRRRTMYQLSATCNDKRNEISYLKNQIQALEGYVTRFK